MNNDTPPPVGARRRRRRGPDARLRAGPRASVRAAVPAPPRARCTASCGACWAAMRGAGRRGVPGHLAARRAAPRPLRAAGRDLPHLAVHAGAPPRDRRAAPVRPRGRRCPKTTNGEPFVPEGTPWSTWPRPEDAIDELVFWRRAGAKLLECLEQLPVAQKTAFLLHHEDGITLDEISRALEIGFETAKSRLRYALSKLRTCMGAYLDAASLNWRRRRRPRQATRAATSRWPAHAGSGRAHEPPVARIANAKHAARRAADERRPVARRAPARGAAPRARPCTVAAGRREPDHPERGAPGAPPGSPGGDTGTGGAHHRRAAACDRVAAPVVRIAAPGRRPGHRAGGRARPRAVDRPRPRAGDRACTGEVRRRHAPRRRLRTRRLECQGPGRCAARGCATACTRHGTQQNHRAVG